MRDESLGAGGPTGGQLQEELSWNTTDHDGRPEAETVSYVDLRLVSRDPEATWKRCALTSDFLAGFLAPTPDADEREELSVVIDELLANAVKFSADITAPVSMAVQHFGDAVRVEASNVCDEENAQALIEALKRVVEQNLEDLFVQQIEESAAADQDSSKLGFITLRMNFDARLGARVTRNEDGLYTVTVAVLLDRSGGEE